MEYKVGDLVRVIDNDGVVPYGTILQVIKCRKNEMITTSNGSPWLPNSSLLEPATHLTTKEFIKLVEDMGYVVNEKKVHYLNEVVLYIDTKDESRFAFVSKTYTHDLSTNYSDYHNLSLSEKDFLLKVLFIYANTPLELREEKEQLYTLQCPITNWYLWANISNFDYAWQNAKNKGFTKKEIDKLKEHNADLINALKPEPVKDD